MHKPMYVCPQQMSILYLVYDDSEVTRALDMSVSSNIFNISFTGHVINCKPQFKYSESTYLHIHM